jgi:hypothetical protein
LRSGRGVLDAEAGKFGNVSLSDGVIVYAKTHEEIKGAFLTFQKNADQIYPGWKEKLGYTGASFAPLALLQAAMALILYRVESH